MGKYKFHSKESKEGDLHFWNPTSQWPNMACFYTHCFGFLLRYVMSFLPSHEGTGRLVYCPQITQLVGIRADIQTRQSVWVCQTQRQNLGSRKGSFPVPGAHRILPTENWPLSPQWWQCHPHFCKRQKTWFLSTAWFKETYS